MGGIMRHDVSDGRRGGRVHNELIDEKREWGKLAREHVPLTATFVLFVFVMLRVLAVARYDRATALAILQSTSPPAVVLALLMQFFPMVVASATVALLAVLSLRDVRATFRPHWPLVTLAAILGTFVTLFAAPVAVLILAPFYFAMFAAARSLALRKALAGSSIPAPPVNGNAVLAFLVLAVATLAGDPWLPPEIISTGEESWEGFVLNEGATVDILLANPREVMRLPASSVTSRAICADKRGLFARVAASSVVELLDNPLSNRPACPSYTAVIP
jgi:hypothetical protein